MYDEDPQHNRLRGEFAPFAAVPIAVTVPPA